MKYYFSCLIFILLGISMIISGISMIILGFLWLPIGFLLVIFGIWLIRVPFVAEPPHENNTHINYTSTNTENYNVSPLKNTDNSSEIEFETNPEELKKASVSETADEFKDIETQVAEAEMAAEKLNSNFIVENNKGIIDKSTEEKTLSQFNKQSSSKNYNNTSYNTNNSYNLSTLLTSHLSNIIDDYVLKYKYEQNLYLTCDINNIIGCEGEYLDFYQEPENEYDSNAIAIYLHNKKIGYVYKGTIQDMIHDWKKRNEYFKGILSTINTQDNTATYIIGFYKNIQSLDTPSKDFSLIKTKKKIDDYTNRNDNLCNCHKGETVSVEYDYECNNYVVYNECGEEIGELNSKASEYIEKNEYSNIIGIISEYDYDYNLDAKVKIRIYLI